MTLTNLFSFSLRSFVHNTYADKTVELATNDGYQSLASIIHNNIPQLQDNTWFWSSIWQPNGHIQTVHAALGNFENVDRIYYGRRLITFEDDGSTVSADYVLEKPTLEDEWDEKYSPIEDSPPLPSRTRYLRPEEVLKLSAPEKEEKPLVILLHGLTGGSHESYVRASITPMIETYGFDCVVLNSRGCARTKISTPMLFCALMTDDVRRFVKMIKKDTPNRKLYLVGYSLGACIAANYLGQEGEESQIEASCTVAAPWDLNVCSYALNSTWIGRNAYSKKMASNLKRLVKNHRAALEDSDVYQTARLTKIETVADFDNAYTAPFFGFTTGQDYYRKASPVNRLLNVRTPMLILSALDDPIAGSMALPYEEVKANPYCFMSATDVGGHLGWFQPRNKRWFPDIIAKFFKTIDEQVDSSKPAKAEIVRQKNIFNGERLVLN